MTRDRSVAGTFGAPPTEFVDRTGETIRIELLAPEHSAAIDRLVAMYLDFDPTDRAQGIPPIKRASIRSWLDDVIADGPDVIAWNEDDVIGHATLVPDEVGEFELAIFVHQEHRRRGVGSALLRALLGQAAAEGITEIWLTVERWNTSAIRLYESVGFEPEDGGGFELGMYIRLDASHR